MVHHVVEPGGSFFGEGNFCFDDFVVHAVEKADIISGDVAVFPQEGDSAVLDGLHGVAFKV